ncbi:MAG: glycerol-3-phosphate 1-O-acyltransferase PlsY [Clostridia bacterium]|nr:glycerol-3-phosphate 1-O-acyltransferase PlsY [Clostridia bacterium]
MSFYNFWNLGFLLQNTADKRTVGELALIIVGVLVTIICAYLLGSINLSIIISSKFYHDDIRQHGSGNAGMTNVMRTYGKKMAVITFVGDFFKAVIASLIGRMLLGYLGAYIAGFFCVLGHIFPIFYKFKGGKGVVTTAAMMFMTSPGVFIRMLAIFVIVVCISRYISLGSVIAGLTYPIVLDRVSGGEGRGGFPVLLAFAVAVFVTWAHRENIKRIVQGNERKFTFKVKDKKTVAEVEAEAKANDDEGEKADD